MRSFKRRFAMRSLVVAVHGALAALALAPATASAEDTDLDALIHRTSWVEIGGLYVDKDSAKFGEFNGLDQKGLYGIGNFGLFGGDGDAGTMRWQVLGNDLGLDTRSVQGEVGQQGRWRVTGGYDEIVRNFSDSYQTIFDGGGSSSLTLPSGYPPATSRVAGGALSNWTNIQTPNATATTTGGGPGYVIPADMHHFDMGTKRKIGDVSVSTILAPGWEVTASAKRIHKDGTKITGVNFGGFAKGNLGVLVPEPIDSDTDTFGASIAYADRKMNFNAGYYGSFYRNDIKQWTVENPGNNNAVFGNRAWMNSYPDNDMHQFNLGGGYRFTQTTRLQVSGSWSRLTQDESFRPPVGSSWVLPETSANAKVNNSFVYARLTSQPIARLSVNASYRYDDRDNKTPILELQANSADATVPPTLRENEPINRRSQTAALEAEYRLGAGQALRAEYKREDIRRTSDAEESPFRSDKTSEDTFKVEYRQALNDALSGRVSYAYSDRGRSEYEQNVGIAPGADAGLVPGFEHFFIAARKRDRLRSQISYQASEAVSVQATLDLNRDRYDQLEFGLKETRGWVFGLDGSARASDQLSFNAYYTYEDMRHELDAFAIPRGTALTLPHTPDGSCASYPTTGGIPVDIFTDPCRNWSQRESDKTHTVGVSAKYVGLLHGRLDLGADLSYSNSRTPIDMSGGTYYSNGSQNVYIPAASFPELKSELTQIRLTGHYAIDRSSSVQVLYIYGHLKTNDWAYDAFTGSPLGVIATTNYIGNGMTSPDYNVNVVGVSYIYRFR